MLTEGFIQNQKQFSNDKEKFGNYNLESLTEDFKSHCSKSADFFLVNKIKFLNMN